MAHSQLRLHVNHIYSLVCVTITGDSMSYSNWFGNTLCASQSIYNNEFTILKKQLVWLVIALAAGVAAFVIPIERERLGMGTKWYRHTGLILTLVPVWGSQ